MYYTHGIQKNGVENNANTEVDGMYRKYLKRIGNISRGRIAWRGRLTAEAKILNG